MGGARLVTERDLKCEPESGEALRGRYGMKVEADHEEAGEVGQGSVLRLIVGGFRKKSTSREETEVGL